VMPRLDGKISAIAEQILKRPLSDEEELEIFRISDAVGMKDVQSFLHLLLVFKLHEETMKGRFDEIAALEKKIHETLEGSIWKILRDSTERIGAEVGKDIASNASGILASFKEFYVIRGYIAAASVTGIVATKDFIDAGEPVISVDTKKKENIGNFKNNGTEYRRNKDPRKVLDHDFPIEELGKITPYGIYNLNHNIGFVNIGISHDTAEFAVESISRWWETVGKHTFPNATKLLITCDCGGSNGNRVRLWKFQLVQLSKRIGIEIHVSHFPPGTQSGIK
jgi:hypothetical protein